MAGRLLLLTSCPRTIPSMALCWVLAQQKKIAIHVRGGLILILAMCMTDIIKMRPPVVGVGGSVLGRDYLRLLFCTKLRRKAARRR